MRLKFKESSAILQSVKFARNPVFVAASLLFAASGLFSASAQSTRPGLGATPYCDFSGTGVTFRVWAPYAASVYVPGQSNGWSTTATPLSKELTGGVWNGNWSADVTDAAVGEQYKFYINYNGSGYWRHDPRARLCTESGGGGNDIVYDTTAFNWGGYSNVARTLDDLVIYELHIGTFFTNAAESRFIAATNRLDYLKRLGVSAVEVMPLAEFPGTESWGYNPAQPFAVENAAYGGPDGFKAFVKACHARGLAVLLDIVHNHYGPTDLDMWNFDGWTGTNSLGGGGVYFFESDTNLQVTPWGYTRPNFSSNQVCSFIQDNVTMWLNECHVDGFRWDAPSGMLYGNKGAYISTAGDLMNSINDITHTNYGGRISIAEDLYDSFGFDSTWDTSYSGAVTQVLTNTVDANRDLTALTNALASNVRYGGAAGFKRVTFLESHDVVGDLNSGIRLAKAIDPATPNSYRARKLSIPGAALTFTSPGVPMLFQGQEMLENQQFNSARPVDWTKTNTYSGIVSFYRDLIRLRRNLDGYSLGLRGDQFSFLKVDTANKVVVSRRWKAGVSDADVVTVANLSGTSRSNYAVPFPSTGTWYVHLNSDSTNYSGDFSSVGTNVVQVIGAVASVDIGPYSVHVLSQQPFAPRLAISRSNEMTRISWPANFAGWALESTTDLRSAASGWTNPAPVQLETNGAMVSASLSSGTVSFYRLRKR